MNTLFFILLIIFILSDKIIGQNNLILNPSFEDIVQCPNDTSSFVDLAFYWHVALGYPRLFNLCNYSTNINYCYQAPRSGGGYAFLTNYLTIGLTTSYIEGQLVEKLKYNKKYFISFYVSPRNCVDWSECYSDPIGLAFSDTLYKEQLIFGAEQIPPFITAIQNPSGNVLTDTVNWTEISGCYTAKGTELFAIIGGFRTTVNSQNEECIGGTGTVLYIDDVGVYEYDPLPDTVLLCSGLDTTLGTSFLNSTYLWNTGETDSLITVNKAGKYVLNATIGSCTLSDTVVVLLIDELLLTLPIDTFICEGELLIVNLTIPGNYIWSDGSIKNHILVETEGFYSVSIENKCGTFEHTFEVESEICACDVYIPNVFSPNNDGQNDFLTYFVGCDFLFTPKQFQVFDRWGNIVYSNNSTDPLSILWDGNFRGQEISSGVYSWVFKYEYIRNGVINKKTISGDVNITR